MTGKKDITIVPGFRDAMNTVSPSGYGKLRHWKQGGSCPLNMLWTGQPMLTPYPAAKLGDVVHGFMEHAGNSSADKWPGLWLAALKLVEDKLKSHWTTRGLVPLQLTTRGYELKRQLILLNIQEASPGLPFSAVVPAAPRRVLKEEEIISGDKVLKGRIDLATEHANGWVLTDFKSGGVLEDDGKTGSKIKESYELQMLLYACLMQEAMGITLKKAVLKTLDGAEYPVDLDPKKVAAAGLEARRLRLEFNAMVSCVKSPQKLAVPLPAVFAEATFGCFGCLYRPACRAYKAERKNSEAGKVWPRDAWGSVSSIKQSGDRMEFTLQNQNDTVDDGGKRTNDLLRVSLNASLGRHPNLEGLKEGDYVEAYEYLVWRSRGVVVDGPRTCIYREDHSQDKA